MRGKIERWFESALWNFRFVILVAVIALLIGSLAAFYLGAVSVYEAIMQAVHAHTAHTPLETNRVIVYLISSIDEFLLGIIMIIISLGIYELFISKLDVIGGDEKSPYPKWLTFHSLEELKAVLTKVIVIILMVYFFKSVVMMKFDTPLSIMYLAIGIILIALANYLSHKPHYEKNSKHK
jgi:uncharacterized membrane protein YqhA